MPKKDCRKCAFVVKVFVGRYFCRKLGVTVYPEINGCSTCCWYKETADEEELEDLPNLYP